MDLFSKTFVNELIKTVDAQHKSLSIFNFNKCHNQDQLVSKTFVNDLTKTVDVQQGNFKILILINVVIKIYFFLKYSLTN